MIAEHEQRRFVVVLGIPVSESVSAETRRVDNSVYRLRWAHAERIEKTAFDHVVTLIDVAESSPDVVPAPMRSSGGDKTVPTCLSVGQAEGCRFYWDDDRKTNPTS